MKDILQVVVIGLLKDWGGSMKDFPGWGLFNKRFFGVGGGGGVCGGCGNR